MTEEDASTALLVVGCGLMISAIFVPVKNRRAARPLFWVISSVGVGLMAISMAPRGGVAVLTAAGVGAVVLLWSAYSATPFLKVGKRIHALHVWDARPDGPDGEDPGYSPTPAAESYDGSHRAVATWWLVALWSCGLGIALVLTHWAWPAWIVIGGGSVLIATFGFDDGRRGLPHARGNRVPFLVAAVGSLAAAGVPLVAYLVAYRLGRRPPSRRDGRHARA